MLNQGLVEQYWRDVIRILNDSGVEAPVAEQALVRFREEVLPRVGETVYNRNPAEVAKTVAGAMKAGLLEGGWPPRTTEERQQPAVKSSLRPD